MIVCSMAIAAVRQVPHAKSSTSKAFPASPCNNDNSGYHPLPSMFLTAIHPLNSHKPLPFEDGEQFKFQTPGPIGPYGRVAWWHGGLANETSSGGPGGAY